MRAIKCWRPVSLGLAVLAISAGAAAATLTEADKREGLAHLDRTRAALLAATKGLSEAQWKFKPAPDRWSIAEVLEHIAVTEKFLLDNTSAKVMAEPPGKPDRDYKSADKLVVSAIADRSRPAQAPEPVRPSGRWSHKEALDEFVKARERTVEFLKSTPGLRDHVADSPLGQPLDAYQWLLYISAHSERHTKQILEVKADPGFPKN
jgi:uncharacterized damage-inducible protein DinB